jgi:hypothetical protein
MRAAITDRSVVGNPVVVGGVVGVRRSLAVELLLATPASVDLLRLEEAPAELAARVRSEGQLLWTQEGA